MKHAVASAESSKIPADQGLRLRLAVPGDVARLVALEQNAFDSDRLTRRSFQHLLTRGHAVCLVAEQADAVAGYAIVLLHGNTSLARLYSIAVDPSLRKRGVGARLLAEAESRALAEGSAVLRLEVRQDNESAIRAYRTAGYRVFAEVPDYYEDGATALRMQKTLAGGDRPELRRVPYYAQTLEFTCGPACLLMAMQALDPRRAIDQKLELRLWRESTLVFMTSGHGGCGAHGLALAVKQRGFDVAIFTTEAGVPFVDSVRDPTKKLAMSLVQEDFQEEVEAAGIPVEQRGLSAAELADAVGSGAIPVVLISSYRIYGEKTPHWVVVTGADPLFLYIHDPFVDWEEHKTPTDCINVPIARAEFDRMARYGASRLRAALLIRPVRGRRRRRCPAT